MAPSTRMSAPVMNEDPSEARKSAACAISRASPKQGSSGPSSPRLQESSPAASDPAPARARASRRGSSPGTRRTTREPTTASTASSRRASSSTRSGSRRRPTPGRHGRSARRNSEQHAVIGVLSRIVRYGEGESPQRCCNLTWRRMRWPLPFRQSERQSRASRLPAQRTRFQLRRPSEARATAAANRCWAATGRFVASAIELRL